VLPQHNVLLQLAPEYHGAKLMALQAGAHLTFWLAIAGIVVAWIFNLQNTALAEKLKLRLVASTMFSLTNMASMILIN